MGNGDEEKLRLFARYVVRKINGSVINCAKQKYGNSELTRCIKENVA